MKVAHCGAMLQVGPRLCAPTVRSSIWRSDLALTGGSGGGNCGGGGRDWGKGPLGWLPQLGSSSPENLGSSHAPYASPLLFFPSSSPRRTQWSDGGKLSPAKLHLVITSHTPAASSSRLRSDSCLFQASCPHSAVTNGDISFLIFLSVGAHRCVVRHIKVFPFFILPPFPEHAMYLHFVCFACCFFQRGDADSTLYLEAPSSGRQNALPLRGVQGETRQTRLLPSLSPSRPKITWCDRLPPFPWQWRHFSIHLCRRNCFHLAPL